MFLFFIYLALYAGFVGITAFSFKSMGVEVLAGINLAVWYGLGLIVAALV